MLDQQSNQTAWKPGHIFYIGLATVLLANMLPLDPNWQTFIHMWRVEIAASIFLGCTLFYLLLSDKRFSFLSELPSDEWKFIVLPIVAFILWSSLSALWAPSWKSAIHHSLIWAQYLIFYMIFRQVLERDSGFSKLLTAFVLTIVFYAIPLVIEYWDYLSIGGTTSLGYRFAKYGEQVVTILPIVLLGVIRTRGKQFAIGASAVVLMWLLIFCSLGRVNYFLFGCVIAGLFASLLISRRHRRYVPRFAFVVTLLIFVLIPLHLFLISSSDAVVPMVNRLNDTAATSSSNNFRKLMLSISKEMIRANPLIGIGADNYGMQVNRYREEYGAANPTDINLANADEQIPSHTHNELVQIVAELGLVGGLIFAWFLAGLAVIAFRSIRNIRSGSLYPFASVLGIGMFLASSLVSSYSFRVMQNGIVFFFVLAVASKLAFKREPTESDDDRVIISPAHSKLALATGILVCAGLFVYSSVRLSSVIIAMRANQTKTLERAMPLYQLAMSLDNENPNVRQNLGMRLFWSRRYNEAVPHLESAIAIGRAPSSEISYLATAKALAGDDKGAEESMASGSSLYPRSPFVLTRYATILEHNGKAAESAAIFNRAVEIDKRAAKTWRVLIESGPRALTDLAARDAGYFSVTELRPTSAMYAVVTERLIRHPEEQKYSLGKLPDGED